VFSFEDGVAGLQVQGTSKVPCTWLPAAYQPCSRRDAPVGFYPAQQPNTPAWMSAS